MISLASLQAPLTRRSGKALYAVLLFKLGVPDDAREFLRRLLPRISPGDVQETAGTPLLNVFLSWRAVATLVTGNPELDSAVGRRHFEPFFTDPLQAPDSLAMAGQLGFTGPSAPEHWWADFGTADIDLAVYLGCDTEQERLDLLEELRSAASVLGLVALTLPTFPHGAVTGYLPPGGILHFGYRDGITTPKVDWNGSRAQGTVDFREFLLGYPSDDYPTAPYPDGPWRNFARHGSFACLTWIQQDVAGFNAFLAENGVRTPAPEGTNREEWLAARLLGRWRDGSPLARYPDAPPAQPDFDDHFGYASDPAGVRCPLDAHIRIANSRDQGLSSANSSRFPQGPPRLIRRGFTYGDPLSGSVDDQKDRGLFGIFICARINEQFYTVLRWMQQTDFSDAFDSVRPGRSGQDRLLGTRLPGGGNRAPNITIGLSSDNSLTGSSENFIRYRGVVPLFIPSVETLQILSAR